MRNLDERMEDIRTLVSEALKNCKRTMTIIKIILNSGTFDKALYGEAKSIEENMAAKGQVSPEVLVMQKLAKDGFIAELKRAYRLCQYAPEPSVPEPEDETSSNLIIKVTQTPQAWLPDTKILREWHRDLSQLIDGFRNEMVEF